MQTLGSQFYKVSCFGCSFLSASMLQCKCNYQSKRLCSPGLRKINRVSSQYNHLHSQQYLPNTPPIIVKPVIFKHTHDQQQHTHSCTEEEIAWQELSSTPIYNAKNIGAAALTGSHRHPGRDAAVHKAAAGGVGRIEMLSGGRYEGVGCRLSQCGQGARLHGGHRQEVFSFRQSSADVVELPGDVGHVRPRVGVVLAALQG